MQILLVGDIHVAASEIRSVKVLLFVIAPAFIEAWIPKEYVAALSKRGAIPEIIFPVRVNGVVAREVSAFPVLDIDIKAYVGNEPWLPVAWIVLLIFSPELALVNASAVVKSIVSAEATCGNVTTKSSVLNVASVAVKVIVVEVAFVIVGVPETIPAARVKPIGKDPL